MKPNKMAICQHCGKRLGRRRTPKGAIALFNRHWPDCKRKDVMVPCGHLEYRPPPPPGYG